jgi:hypothetical protein
MQVIFVSGLTLPQEQRWTPCTAMAWLLLGSTLHRMHEVGLTSCFWRITTAHRLISDVKFCHESTTTTPRWHCSVTSLRRNLLTWPAFKLRFTSRVIPATEKFIRHKGYFVFVTVHRMSTRVNSNSFRILNYKYNSAWKFGLYIPRKRFKYCIFAALTIFQYFQIPVHFKQRHKSGEVTKTCREYFNTSMGMNWMLNMCFWWVY